MLSDNPVYATIPTADLDRLRRSADGAAEGVARASRTGELPQAVRRLARGAHRAASSVAVTDL